MNLERYEYKRSWTFKEYDFYSIGPKGRIRKVVRFRTMTSQGAPCYNLSFGDWNSRNEKLDDSTVTNNGDTEKVLATVAAIVVNFTTFFPEAMVYAEGLNAARTRRYQMGISKLLNEIQKTFNVYGRIDKSWKPFRKNENYNAFLVTRKQLITLEEETDYYMKSALEKNDNKKIHYNDIVDVEMETFDNDPFFIKKDEMARKSIEKYGLPEELMKQYRDKES